MEAGNVVGIQYGSEFPDEYIVICCHYDHPDGPGADDNASGTAGMLECARILSRYSFKRSIMYVAFNAEEYWMEGSKPFVRQCAEKNMNILGVFNLDMIAFHPESIADLAIHAGYSEISKRLYDYYTSVATTYLPEIPMGRFSKGDAYGGDHSSFHIYDYPALYIGDIEYLSLHPCYHQPCDTIGNGANNFSLARAFTQATLAATAGLADAWLPPQRFRALPGDGKVTLHWDQSPLTNKYKIYKNDRFLIETAEISYTDEEVQNGETYRYYVVGVDFQDRESNPSNCDSARPSPPLLLPYFNDFETHYNEFRVNEKYWGLSDFYYSGSHSLGIKDDYFFTNNFSTYAELQWFTVAPETGLALTLYLSGNFFNKAILSNLSIEATTDRRSWEKLYSSSDNIQGWSFPVSIPLDHYAGSPFVQIRIRFESSGENESIIAKRMFIDDFRLETTPLRVIRHENKETFDIYPNPGNGLFAVATSQESPYSLKVFDIYGSEIVHYPSFQDRKLNLSHLPSGIYLVKISQPGMTLTKKIVIM